MACRQLLIDIPETVLLAEKMDEITFACELRMLAAVKLYELGRLPSGQAGTGSSPWKLSSRIWRSPGE
jgi:hypothetical protein